MFFRHRRRRFFRFIILALLLLGICGLFSSTAYQSGWSQGFASSQTADGVPVGNVPGSHGFGFFSLFWWGLAAFFKFWLFLFFIGLICKFLFWGRRGRHRGRPFGPWGGGQWGGWHGKWHDHHHHEGRHRSEGRREKGPDFKGQRPPWYDDSSGEPVMKA